MGLPNPSRNIRNEVLECKEKVSTAAIEDFVAMSVDINIEPNLNRALEKRKQEAKERIEPSTKAVSGSFFTSEMSEIIKVLFKLGKLPEALSKCRDAYHVMMKTEVRKVTYLLHSLALTI